MKKILISIKPKWTAKILNGDKTIEVRRTAPKCELPCEVYIYCTKEKLSLNLWTSKTKEKCRKAILEYTESQADKELDEFINAEFVERYPQYRGERVIFSPQTLNGKVVARFTLNKVEKIKCYDIGFGVRYCVPNNDPRDYPLCEKSCLTQEELNAYLKEKVGYAWHIDNLVIFDKPKELKDFGVKRSPQSWQFVEVDE